MKNEKNAITWQDVLNEKEDYQWRMVEISASNSGIERYSNEQSVANNLVLNEEIQDLRLIIYNELLLMANDCLNSNQLLVFNWTLEGRTQVEISQILGNTQSAINKCLFGSDDYKCRNTDELTGKYKKYGGIYQKLKKFAKRNKIIQDSLDKIQKLKNAQ